MTMPGTPSIGGMASASLAAANPYLAAAGLALDIGSQIFGPSGMSERKSAALQYEYQQTVAQNQLQWRAEDAKKAGISKLYAMGAPAVSFAPSISGNGSQAMRDLSGAGQSITRAVEAGADSKQRAVLFDQQSRLNEINIKDAEISLMEKASRMALAKTGAVPPLDNARSGSLNRIPSEVVASGSGMNNTKQTGDPATWRADQIDPRDGGYGIGPSTEKKQQMDDDMIQSLLWHLQHRAFGPPNPSPDYKWDFWRQRFMPKSKSERR